jgi:hypothetical protein
MVKDKMKLLGFVILMMMCMIGCASSNEDSVVRFLNTNPRLTSAERDYAKRYYRVIVISYGYPKELTLKMDQAGFKGPYSGNIQLFDQTLYQKWGLGDGPFSLHEKAYLDHLDRMVREWESYQRKLSIVDIPNITEEQSKALTATHKKCGEDPVNFRLCMMPDSANNPDGIRYCDILYVLTGHEELTDKEILALMIL